MKQGQFKTYLSIDEMCKVCRLRGVWIWSDFPASRACGKNVSYVIISYRSVPASLRVRQMINNEAVAEFVIVNKIKELVNLKLKS
jgi:hypothetical protein